MKKLFAIATVSGLAAASMAVAPAAQAKTIQACVKKSDGSVKFINKKNKKCKKGWKLKTWNSQGPQGPAGPAGPNWTVKDKNGVTLGTFSGYYSAGLVPMVAVSTDDGSVFLYGMDGTLDNDDGSLYFVNNGCSDAAVYRPTANAAQLQPYLKAAGGNGRSVFQVTNAPTASAWKVATTTTATVPVAANSLFQKDKDTGVCAAATHLGGFIVPLTPATAPVVAAPGPLQIVR
jgi:hypothetical protein